MGRVVVFGSLSQDLHLTVQRQPRPGETLMSSDIEYRFGGKGANQAVAAARGGAPSVFVGKVGDDPQGREYRGRLEAFGVDTSKLEVDPQRPTGTAIIIVDAQSENMIVVAPGANGAMSEADLGKLDDLGEGDILLMPLELPHDVVCAAARKAHGQGARVILNLSPFAELPEDVLDLCDPIVVNEHEAADMQQSAAAAGRDISGRSVLITKGTAGSQWGEVQVPADRADAVDTTGAGDAFCGTLAARLCLGDDKESAMRAASAAAARNVEHHGAQPPLPE